MPLTKKKTKMANTTTIILQNWITSAYITELYGPQVSDEVAAQHVPSVPPPSEKPSYEDPDEAAWQACSSKMFKYTPRSGGKRGFSVLCDKPRHYDRSEQGHWGPHRTGFYKWNNDGPIPLRRIDRPDGTIWLECGWVRPGYSTPMTSTRVFSPSFDLSRGRVACSQSICFDESLGLYGHTGYHSVPAVPLQWVTDKEFAPVTGKIKYPYFVGGHATLCKQAGLHQEWNLAQMCADFYLLERLAWHVTREEAVSIFDLMREDRPSGWARRTPLHHQSDTRDEVYERAVVEAWTNIRRRLSNEFMVYIPMVCGGELRHAAGYSAWKCGTDPEKVHIHDNDCYAECPARKHRCVDSGCGYATQPMVCIKYTHYSHDDHCLVACPMKTDPTLHEHSDACGRGGIPIPDSVEEYYRKAMGSRLSGLSRPQAWQVWLDFVVDKDPVSVLDGLTEAFDAKWWGLGVGVGGRKWQECSRAALMYARGEWSDVSFINQCWTLEHNGGCLFNKIYKSYTYLRPVLDTQERGDYDELSYWGTPYVRDLWRRAS